MLLPPLNRPDLKLACQVVQVFFPCSIPVGIMRVVLDLSTDKLLQQMINVHIMHGSSQLHASTGGRRIARALHSMLECLLYLFFCFSTCGVSTSRLSEACGVATTQLNRTTIAL